MNTQITEYTLAEIIRILEAERIDIKESDFTAPNPEWTRHLYRRILKRLNTNVSDNMDNAYNTAFELAVEPVSNEKQFQYT